MEILDAKGEDLEVARLRLPWWAAPIVLQRGEWMGCAVAKEWDRSMGSFPPEIFVVALAVQQPTGLHLLRCSLKPQEWLEMSAAAPTKVDPWLLWARYDSELDFRDAVDVDFAEDELLFVLPAVLHGPGGVFVRAEPVAFDEFCKAIAPPPEKQRAATSSRRTRATVLVGLLEKLREEFPWLTEEDVRQAKEKVANKLSDSAESGGHPGQIVGEADYEEQAYDKVMAALEEKRQEWAFEDDDATTNFYVLQAGGVWMRKFKGVESDAAHAKGRAHTHAFCKRFSWPRLKVFTFRSYGERACNLMAREWCRKGHFLFEAWVQSVGAETFLDREAEALAFTESEEFLDWAVWSKITELREAWPMRS